MPTKADITQQRDQLGTLLLAVLAEHARLRKKVKDTRLALKVIEGDLQRKTNYTPDYEETGSEQAERFERGILLALSRVGEVKDLLTMPKASIDWRHSIWREGTGE